MSSLRLGFSCRWRKGERGKRVVWIVTEFELFPDKVVLGTPRKMVEDICDTLKACDGKGMIPVKDLRTFLGKLAWVAGIVPRLKWTVTALYANLTKVQQEEQSEYERAQKRTRDQRMKVGLVAVKRMGTTLPWLRAAFESKENMMIRTEPLDEVGPVWGVVTDASSRDRGPADTQSGARMAHLGSIRGPGAGEPSKSPRDTVPAGGGSGSAGGPGSAQGTAVVVHQDSRWTSGHQERQFSRPVDVKEDVVTNQDLELSGGQDSVAPGACHNHQAGAPTCAGETQHGSRLAFEAW